MEYRKLGNAGLVVSNLALGTTFFGSEVPQKEAFAIVDAFVEAGDPGAERVGKTPGS